MARDNQAARHWRPMISEIQVRALCDSFGSVDASSEMRTILKDGSEVLDPRLETSVWALTLPSS